MKRLIILITTLLSSNLVFNQHNHDGHDHEAERLLSECFETKKEQLNSLALSENWEQKFMDKYGLSIQEFYDLNIIHSQTVHTMLLTALCDNTIQNTEALTYVFNFIDTRLDNLLFERPADLSPGQISYGKYFREPSNWGGNNNLSQRGAGNRGPGEPCTNMDFETGDFTGWETYCGSVNGNPYEIVNATLYDPTQGNGCGSANATHLITTGGNDPITGIPMVNPNGGNHSIRIGDGPTTGFGAAMLRQTFRVDPNNAMFSYSYAAIFTEGSHNPGTQPFFSVRIYDANGVEVQCGAYQSYAGDGQPGWQSGGGDVRYLNWVTVFAPLDVYAGQDVTVEVIVGDCNDTGHYGYAYFEASCSPLEIITTSGSAICDGESITLTAPAGGSSYQWSPGGQTTQSINVTGAGNYEVVITPTSGGGLCGAITLNIEVTSGSNPTAEINVLNDNICRFESIEFEDVSDPGLDNTITSYQWDFGDGNIIEGNGNISGEANTTGTYNNPTHTYNSEGTFTVTLTIINSGGCSSTTTTTVTVRQAPLITTGPDITACYGDLFTPNAQGGDTYTWNDPSLQNGVEIQVPNITTTYTVTGYDSFGCFNTADFTVTIETPLIDAGPDQTICSGESVVLTGDGAPSYTWDNSVQDGVPFTPTQTTTYTVSYTSPNGCVASDQVTVTLTPLPVISGGNDVNVCVGQTIVLTATGGVSYVWDNGITDGTPFNQDIGSVVYTVTGTDANGCSNTDQVNVTVNDMPSPTFNITNNLGCAPLIPVFSNTTPGAGNSCLWNFGNGLVSTDCNATLTSVYTVPGCYDVSLTITTPFGCSTTITENAAVCLYSNPTAAFTVTPTIMSSIDPVADFDNNSSNAVTYEWDFGDDSGSSSETNPSHVFEETGAITVMLVAISPDGCRDTTYQTVIINEELIVYVPNAFTPDNDDYNEVFLPILHSGFDPMTYHLIIFNRWGETMFESYDHTVGWNGTYGGKIVQDGTYIWRITVKRNNVDKREVFNGHVTIIR